MLKKSIIAFVCVTALVALSGCFQKIKVEEVIGFTNLELGLKGIKSDMIVNVYNPNYIDFNITSADIELSIGEIIAGDLIIEDPVILKSRSTTEVVLKVEGRKGAVRKMLFDNFTNSLTGGEVLLKAEGEILSKKFGLKKKLPIIHQEIIEL